MTSSPNAPSIELTPKLDDLESSPCRFCGNLAQQHTQPIPIHEWIEGITQSSCRYCHVLLKAIKQLDPKIINDDCARESSDVSVQPLFGVNGHREFQIIEYVKGMTDFGHILLSISFFRDRGSISSQHLIGIGRELSMIPGDPHMWDFVKECFTQCTTSHSVCLARQAINWFPSRLLLISKSSRYDNCTVRLIESISHKPKSGYIALSHCWGNGEHLRTTTRNLNSHHSGISFDELPETFRDCVIVAQELGVQYIWIDSLCIIQDQRSDWAHNSQMMGKIYEQAILTVAAVSSANSSTPFLGPQAPSLRRNYQHFEVDVSAISPTVPKANFRRCPTFQAGSISGPLESRAWAWQERYLSTRTLNFTEEQVHWQCATITACECDGVIDERYWASTDTKRSMTMESWYNNVSDYSRRDLTYLSDRLPALSGVASRFSASFESEYLAGLWLSDFPKCLSWYRRGPHILTPIQTHIEPFTGTGVPSWSWASITDAVEWIWTNPTVGYFPRPSTDLPGILSCVELISYECLPLNPENIFGEVTPGSYLELKGRMLEADIEIDNRRCGLVRKKGFKPQIMVPDYDPFATKELCSAFPWEKVQGSEKGAQRVKTHVFCLLLFTIEQKGKPHPCIIIIQRLTSTVSEPSYHTYRRIGIAEGGRNLSGPTNQYRYRDGNWWERRHWKDWEELGLWEDWEDWFADAEVETVRIV